jgi:hypothetical protein
MGKKLAAASATTEHWENRSVSTGSAQQVMTKLTEAARKI